MQVKDIMKREVISVSEEDSLVDVLMVLLENNISGVPVLNERQEVIGILTEQDLMTKRKVLNIPSYLEFIQSILSIDGELQQAKKDAIQKLSAKDIMSSPVYTVGENHSIEEVVCMMVNRRINHIPVVDKKRSLVGIIGRGDLLPLLINQLRR
ncbi:hypothetical protein CS063_13955 [Sporanaerobium hydrogeniformans]|uniref:Uncharacterized protein n=1 Tax=Sporanaerobium hydrogeniformans TaxID=3072179 RepID=A0AC61DA83_9FIRM|nr:CBS domain-containing protein [Sporanaerobium hydrogeniformans]PHV69815.1 hypothetical protein CS063_13955 [Sporanaerobium hydrogeniformans]